MTALLTIILSFIGALVCGLMPPSAHRRIRWVALAVAVGGLVVSMACCVNYSGGAFADLVVADWIPSLGIGFVTGYDGISLPLLLVTGLVAVCGVLFSCTLEPGAHQVYAVY